MHATRTVTTSDNLSLAVWEHGEPDAPTVVLVHGYPDTHLVWDGVAEELARDHHVVAYDVRGAGASDAPHRRAGYDLTHLVADLVAVVEATAPSGPVHVVGHDWGSVQSWEAVTTGALGDRLASFCSISGPCLDHVGQWLRDRRRDRDWGPLLRQGLHSWYVGFFHLPGAAPFGWRRFAEKPFRRYLSRVEGLGPDAQPGPTLPSDGANGVELYRRNVRSRLAEPQERTTDVPVLLVVPTRDRYITGALLDDVGRHCRDLRRIDVDAGHWLPAAQPDVLAALIREHVRASTDAT
ncbi:MAG TPA: alpha/beta fold hydrolase [Acidimicrobiales bacterium]|nr:alpha/beta fold hydrolase [Acidimicrobiales bacterium]